MKAPDFYLASTEGYDMDVPRRGWRVKRMSTPERDDLLLARIDPPLPGQEYGLGANYIDLVLLATRHKGTSLFPITEWPAFVHVARPLVNDVESRNSLLDSELQNIAWAELYRTEEDARLKVL